MITSQQSSSERAVYDYMQQLSESRFWGSITLKFQRGAVVHITKEESIQPDQLAPERRRNSVNRHDK